MSHYEDKLYDFITAPENFEFAHEIWDKYGDIEERIIKEFWNEVKSYCETECPQSFSLKTNDDFVDGEDPYLYYDKDNWAFFGIGFSYLMDEPLYGIYFINLNKKIENKIIKYANDLKILDGYYVEYDEDDGYFAWKNTNHDFDNLSLSVLKRILPNKRDEMVKLYGNYLINLSKEMEKTIDKWEIEIKEGKI